MSKVSERIRKMIEDIKPTKLYSLAKVAKIFGVSSGTLKKWVDEGILPAKIISYKTKKLYYISGITILNWLSDALEVEEAEKTEGGE